MNGFNDKEERNSGVRIQRLGNALRGVGGFALHLCRLWKQSGTLWLLGLPANAQGLEGKEGRFDYPRSKIRFPFSIRTSRTDRSICSLFHSEIIRSIEGSTTS